MSARTGSDLEAAMLFQIRATGLPAPVLQHRFHPPRRFRFDFCWPEQMVALEVDGGTWVAGRHSRGAGIASDMEKANLAVLDGWRVLRVDNHMVEDGRALGWVEEALRVAA